MLTHPSQRSGSSRFWSLAVVLGCTLSASACTCERSDSPSDRLLAAASANPAAAEPTSRPERLGREDPETVASLPVEEDFQQQVAREIRVDNLEEELDKIERELSSAPK